MSDRIELPEDAPQELIDALEEIEGGDDGPMTEEEFQGAIKGIVTAAANYIDNDIAPRRELAWRYYRGEAVGVLEPQEGSSKVVMTEVRDTVQAMMPSLMRVFTSSENAVEFVPRRGDQIEQAEQATDYVNYVFNEDNPGFTILTSGFKDSLVGKIGVFQWHTAERTRVAEEVYTGLEEGQLQLLSQAPNVEILEVEADESEPIGEEFTEAPGEDAAEGENTALAVFPMAPAAASLPPAALRIKLRRTISDRRQVVESVPPEEFIISPTATSLDTADFVGRRSLKTLSELLQLGYDREEIEEHGEATGSFSMNTEALARNPDIEHLIGAPHPGNDPSMERYLFIEGYARVDKDGDGIAELRRVCALGDNCHVLHDEVVEDVKLAIICPDPEPHQVIGSSIADQVMDLQEIKSNVVRNTLDSLANAIHPRTAYVEGQVNADDLMNTEQGALVRMTQPGMVQELGSSFLGQQAMPVISYLDDVRAARTGISKASQGLDPDVLQSTTRAAVTATMAAAEQRLEMVARVFAETGIKRLFKGLLKEVIENQDKPRVIRLRNKWVEVDPRSWDADMDVIVNVGLGTGSAEQRVQLLTMVNQDQEKILTTMGPQNPLVTVKQYRDTKAKILRLSGIKDPESFYQEITPEAMEQMAQQAQQPPKPDAAEMLAQVEAQKIQADIQIAQMKAQLEIEKQKAADDLERDKLDADIYLRTMELQMKYGTQVQVENIYAMIQRNRDQDKAALQQQQLAQQAQHQAAQREQQAAVMQQRMQQQQQAAQQPPQGMQ